MTTIVAGETRGNSEKRTASYIRQADNANFPRRLKNRLRESGCETMELDQLSDWRRTHYSSVITPDLDQKQVTVFGWVEDIRDLGGLTFLSLRDRKGAVQITIPKKRVSNEVLDKVGKLGRQFSIGVRGKVQAKKEAPRGVEIFPEEIRILGSASYPLPMDPTGRVPADIDVRLNARILDLRREECRSIFNIKNTVIGEVDNFLRQRDFIEVHTPKIIATATEGGASLFPVEYFENKAYLAQSPELYKEALTSVFENVYEIGLYFRAEESRTTRHLSEFISMDVEEAFADISDVMKLQEELTVRVIDQVRLLCEKELKTLAVELRTPILPMRRYTYDQILEELDEVGQKIVWGEDIPTIAYRELGNLHKGEFYFITDWPTKVRPFYIKPKPDRPELCDAFDFMYEWIEVTSGGTRVDSKDVYVARLKEQGLDPTKFKFYLDNFDCGLPPHAGFGMGLDRFLMGLLNRENIKEVVLFPRDRFRLVP